MQSPENLLVLLESVILMQMLLENLETLQGSHYNKTQLKKQMKDTIRIIEPLAIRDYGIVFSNGEEDTQAIIFEYEKLIRFISLQKLPQKVLLSQLVESYNYDQKTIEATVHRILKKHSN